MDVLIFFIVLYISIFIFAIIVRYIGYLEYKQELKYKKDKVVKEANNNIFYYETKTYTPISKGKVNKC